MFNRNPSSLPPSDPPGVSGDLGIPNLRPDGPPIREISPSSQEINEPAEVIVSRVLFALLISASLVSIFRFVFQIFCFDMIEWSQTCYLIRQTFFIFPKHGIPVGILTLVCVDCKSVCLSLSPAARLLNTIKITNIKNHRLKNYNNFNHKKFAQTFEAYVFYLLCK